MSVDHRQLYVSGDSSVHRLDPAIKIVATLLFVVAVALLPRYQLWPALANLAVILVVLPIAQLPIRLLALRLLVVIPFVGFAFLIPFIASGPTSTVAGVDVSTEGMWSTWSILTKAVLGASASIVLSSTTSIPDLLRGFAVLRVPSVIVAIVAFMFRYLDLIVDQVHRMRNAMTARAHDPRWFWQATPLALSACALFVRTYEQGERTHLAMLARGYSGQMPDLRTNPRMREYAADDSDASGKRRPKFRSIHFVLAMAPAVVAWLTLAVTWRLASVS